jgi:hypothetical protein
MTRILETRHETLGEHRGWAADKRAHIEDAHRETLDRSNSLQQ